MDNNKTKKLTIRAASAATLWGISRLLETRRGKKVSKVVDRRIEKAGEQVLSRLNRVGKNVRKNRALAAAALTTFAVSIALFSRVATR